MSYRIVPKLLASLLWIGGCAGTAKADNFLRDPGFEEAAVGPLKDWTGMTWAINGGYPGLAGIIKDASQAHSGNAYLRLKADVAASKTHQPFMLAFDVFPYPIEKGNKYTLKAWVRGSGQISIGFECYDNAIKFISPGDDQFSKPVSPGEGAWREISFDYLPNPEAGKLQVNLNVQGSVDVDDMSLDVSPMTEAEAAKAKQSQRQASIESQPAPDVAAAPHDEGENILNGGFEDWLAMDTIPKNWDVAANLVPKEWTIEDRPGENGKIRRIVNSAGENEQGDGKYSLFLDGRLVSRHRFDDVQGKKFHLTLWAKGAIGQISAHIREYVGTGEQSYVVHVMDILEDKTTPDWNKYSADVVIPSGLGGPVVTGASFEIFGHDVVIDRVSIKEMESQPAFVASSYDIPIVADSIAIDGNFSESEWASAAGSNLGFIDLGSTLVKRQPTYYLSSDGKNLLICLRTKIEGTLVRQITQHDGSLWQDDAFEVHINPTPGLVKPPVSYQFIVNSLGTVYDARMNDGLKADTNKDWNCEGLKVASKCEDNFWTLEMAIPLENVGLKKDQPFGFNLCQDLKNPDESANLTGAGYFDYDKMVIGRFDNDGPAIFWGSDSPIGDGPLSLFARVSNSGAAKQDYEVSVSADTDKLTESKKFSISVPAGKQDRATFQSTASPGRAGRLTVAVAEVGTATKAADYGVSFDKAAEKEQKPSGNQILWYPTQHKIGVLLKDSLKGKVASVEVTIKKGDVIVAKPSTTTIEVSPDHLEQAMVDVPALEAGSYAVAVMIADKAGNVLGYDAKTLEVKNFDWLNNKIGKSGVSRPFIPVTHDARSISCWGRKYVFAGSGLPEQIFSQGEKVLNAPVTLSTSGDGPHEQTGELAITKASEQSVEFNGQTSFPNFTAKVHGRLEYDGTIFYDIDLTPKGTAGIDNLQLEIPFRDLKYFHAPGNFLSELWISAYPAKGEYVDNSVDIWKPGFMYIPKGLREHNSLYFPTGDGVIWNSTHISKDLVQGDFLSYLTFGNTHYGMCWMAENDRGWSRDGKTPSYELIRENGESKLKIHFISSTPKTPGTRRISFALAATPIRAKKVGFDYLDWSVMGFGDSSFIEGAFGGLKVTDDLLLDKYLTHLDPKGDKPTLFYNAKAYATLGDPVTRYFYNEWHVTPEMSYNNGTYFPTRKYGLDPDNYFAVAAELYPERIDYMVSQIETLIKDHPAVRGIYWDENYSVPCLDLFHKNSAFRLEDGSIQSAAQTFGVRELDKRVQAVLQENGRPFPNLLAHSTALIPPLFAFSDINLTSERGTKTLDFIDYWDLPRLENALAGAWGLNLMWIPQWGQSNMQGGTNTLANNRSMLAALKLFDVNIWKIWCLPEVLGKFQNAEDEFGISSNDSKFFGYWQDENKKAVTGFPNFVKASFFVRPGRGALLYISNLSKEKQSVKLSLDFKPWGVPAKEIIDEETGLAIPMDGGVLPLDIGAHDFRCLLIK